jgi:hypothetical protein
VYGDDDAPQIFLSLYASSSSRPSRRSRRGKHGGLREIERKILKENTN